MLNQNKYQNKNKYHIELCLESVYICFQQTPKEYLQAYNRKRGRHYSRFHGYAYDGIWVIATAIDSILKQSDNWIFDDLRSQKMHDALNNTDFMGMTVCVTECPLVV